LDEREEWIERTAAELADALVCSAVRAEVLALLDGHERDRARRLAAARRELASLELRIKLAEEEPWI
jgi:predicted nucleic acid-binding protein